MVLVRVRVRVRVRVGLIAPSRPYRLMTSFLTISIVVHLYREKLALFNSVKVYH
jgi:hypothetical protein